MLIYYTNDKEDDFIDILKLVTKDYIKFLRLMIVLNDKTKENQFMRNIMNI